SARVLHDVVGAVEPLSLIGVGQHGDRPVWLGPGDGAAAVLAADQAAAAVHRVPVRVPAGLAEDPYRSGGLVPAQDPVVGDIAEDEVSAGREPGRAFRPTAAGMQPLQPGVAVEEGETFVEYLEPGPDRLTHR